MVSWAAPTSNGGSAITGYTVTTTPGNVTTNTSGTSITVTGLTAGTTYTFSVVAINAVGSSAASAVTAAITGRPGAPTGVTVRDGNRVAKVSWAAPTVTGGLPITQYNVTATDTGNGATVTLSTTGTTIDFTGLAMPREYTFTVKAVNANGEGDAATSAPFQLRVAIYCSNVYDSGSTYMLYLRVTDGGSSYYREYTGIAPQVTLANATLLNSRMNVRPFDMLFVPKPLQSGYYASQYRVAIQSGASYFIHDTSFVISTPSTPAAPTCQITAPGTVSLTWAAPESNNSPITGYALQPYSNGSPVGSPYNTGATTVYTVSDLSEGTYTFRVSATNALGASAYSADSAPVTVSMPTNVVGSFTDGEVTVSWTAPVGGGTLTGYSVAAYLGATLASTKTTTTTSTTISDLTNGSTYTFRVAATNGGVIGAYSAPSAALSLYTAPGAPTQLKAASGVGVIYLNWTAPANTGGLPITKYTILRDFADAIDVSGDQTSAVISGLTVGVPYTFRVVAVNTTGTSAESNSATGTPGAAPEKPVVTAWTEGDSSIYLTWDAPASTGSSGLVSYTIVASAPGGDATATIAGTEQSGTISGLTNGVAYDVFVYATNELFSGPYSDPIGTQLIPESIPGAPTEVVATLADGITTVTWTAPKHPAILYYNVTSSSDGQTRQTDGSGATMTFEKWTFMSDTSFTVSAVARLGEGPQSSSSNTISYPPPVGTAQSLSASVNPRSFGVSWTAPMGSVDSYLVEVYSPDNTLLATQTVSGTTTFATLDYPDGTNIITSYRVTVSGSNAMGAGMAVQYTTPIPYIPNPAAPSAPAAPSVVSGDGVVTVSWSAPASDGGAAILQYNVVLKDACDNQLTAVVDASGQASCTFGGLTNGISYTATVNATNRLQLTGTASAASAAVTPSGLPGAPVISFAGASDASVTIDWEAPADNGAPITGYRITDGSGGTYDASGYRHTITGLTNGRSYQFTIAAINVRGAGAASEPTALLTPTGLPGVPRFTSIVAGDARVTLNWVAPATGGSPITRYSISANGEEPITVGAVTTHTVTGLTNGSVYTFTLTAGNANGDGPAVTSVSVTPAAITTAPRRFTKGALDFELNNAAAPAVIEHRNVDFSEVAPVVTAPVSVTTIAATDGDTVSVASIADMLYIGLQTGSVTLLFGGASYVFAFDGQGATITTPTATLSNVAIGDSVVLGGTTFTIASLGSVSLYKGALPDPAAGPSPVCFFGNAPVLTPSGYRRIDSLRVGDLVCTADGSAVAIERVKVMRCAAGPSSNPFVIPKGVYGATERLLISPRHRVAVPGRGMVEARFLGLEQAKKEGQLTYYNLGLPAWENMVVAGVVVESLAPVQRITMPFAVFKALLTKKYGPGPLSAATLQQIKKTCRFLANGEVEFPVLKRE